MATAEKITTSSFPSRRRLRRAATVLAGAALLALVWFWGPLKAESVTAASHAARVACPCRFIAGRDLSSCRDDLERGMPIVMLSEDAEAKSVTARVPLLASQTATFREGQGCLLEPWEN